MEELPAVGARAAHGPALVAVSSYAIVYLLLFFYEKQLRLGYFCIENRKHI